MKTSGIETTRHLSVGKKTMKKLHKEMQLIVCAFQGGIKRNHVNNLCAYICVQLLKCGITFLRECSSTNKAFCCISSLDAIAKCSVLYGDLHIQKNTAVHICFKVLCLPIILLRRDSKVLIFKDLRAFGSSCSFFLHVLFCRERFWDLKKKIHFLVCF